ncbi:MAG: hypothetical protein NW206_08355 [Hyphomonadaceae bacterium]|nr:hypothetical protein [Hyphomonadaceae bacterium]
MSDVSAANSVWKNFRIFLVIAGLQVTGSLLLALAATRGLISSETTLRGVMVLVGLGLAACGNRIPKGADGLPPRTLKLATLRQSILRMAGWAMMLGGLLFALLWAFVPLDAAAIGATIALGAFMAVTLGGVTWRIFAYHRRQR